MLGKLIQDDALCSHAHDKMSTYCFTDLTMNVALLGTTISFYEFGLWCLLLLHMSDSDREEKAFIHRAGYLFESVRNFAEPLSGGFEVTYYANEL